MSDALDIEHPDQLIEYLHATARIAPDETPRCVTLAGGVSNRTVLVERTSGAAWVLKQALQKLRTKADWFCDPARIEREAAGLRWLERLAPPGTITPLVFEDPAHHLLAMEAVPQPHENWKSMLLDGQEDLDHARQFGELLATVHRESSARADELGPVFADRSFFEQLRIEPYYSYSSANVPASAAFYDALIADTRAARLAVVHGDYSPKNVLVRAGRLVLLDHEVIHWGDPAFDVGFALTHFLSKARHLRPHREKLLALARTFWDTYRTGILTTPWRREVEARVVRHTLGCLLARVAGRSPLEYLTDSDRSDQRADAVEWMRHLPSNVHDLIDRHDRP